MDEKYKKIKRPSTFLKIVVVAMVLGCFITSLNIYELRKLQTDHLNLHLANPEAVNEHLSKKAPIYWIYGKHVDSGYLNHVMRVLERIGYVRGTNNSNWDLLWAHDYPFGYIQSLNHLKPNQRVNKFPGSGWITNKLSLATSNIKQAPKAFRIPNDKEKFLEYAKRNPSKKWVQKSNNHRGIRIKKLDELDFSTGNTFVQEYIDDPYLIDGRRFDIGIYTTLVSIDPLRVYIYDGDWLMRYCAKEYFPFDSTDVKKYVVGDDYTPTWQMPSLKKYYNDMKFTHRESFFHYLRQKNDSVTKLVDQIQEAIISVYKSKEHSLIKSLSSYNSGSNFFEMVRFDFVVDGNLNIYLMEVNMSPNLSTAHFSENRLLYEQVLFSMFSLTGIAKTVADEWVSSSTHAIEMQISERDVQVNLEDCDSPRCDKNCALIECRLCKWCTNQDLTSSFKQTYIEHMNRNRWRRVFPIPFQNKQNAIKWKIDQNFTKLSEKNQLLFLWFRGKCIQDNRWCF